MPVLYGGKLYMPPTNYHLIVLQEPYKKAQLFNETYLSFLKTKQKTKTSQENGPLPEKMTRRKEQED